MKLHRLIASLFQAVTIGLALAFLILLWRPELLDDGRKVVQIVERSVTLPEGVTRTTADRLSYADAVESAAPAVVNIHTRKRIEQTNMSLFHQLFGSEIPSERSLSSLGSGVIINAAGYLLTNNHVIVGADSIQVSLQDGRTAPAEVVGTDPESDLAVLKINLSQLPVIVLGPSERLRVGDVVLAIGNPFGVGQTVTQGIVSAIGRNRVGINTFENFIQTDAAINPGNSGGALITATGELIGINTAIFSRSGGSQGIGFAIPMSMAKGVMQQIVEYGHVRRGWLGIEIQTVTPLLAKSFNLPPPEGGVLVAGILKEGPAARGGVETGDIIQRINNTPVTSVRNVLTLIAQTRPGGPIALQVRRHDQSIHLDLTVAERPAQQ